MNDGLDIPAHLDRRHEAPGLEAFAILLDDLDDAESVLLRQRGEPGTGDQL